MNRVLGFGMGSGYPDIPMDYPTHGLGWVDKYLPMDG